MGSFFRVLAGLFFLSTSLHSQQNQVNLILKLRANDRIDQIIPQSYSIDPDGMVYYRCISASESLYKVSIHKAQAESFIKNLDKLPSVLWVDEDVELKPRREPDDTQYNKQWHLPLIEAMNTWDITTGGYTPFGDTIVIAILDDGFMPDHIDLWDNIYRNHAEIPGDGKDNDNNGYIDDYLGLNPSTGRDNHPVKTHGTATAGLIGAVGNNSEGVVGVNWNIKIMLISEANSVSNVIEAYEYILASRNLYNNSSGQKGAFIVATNLSAGIDNAFPEDNPVFQEWCKLYDKLGEAGILNVNAVTNNFVNIDVVGDMPATCTSIFLIKTTSTDKNDRKAEEGGYGKVHVNLTAPGKDIFTTKEDNKYASFTGTSNAAPLVAGCIGLLYASPCLSFAQMARNDRSTAALAIKSMIFEGSDKLNWLDQYSSTGGRLNLNGAMGKMRDFCEGFPELAITKLYPNPSADYITIEFETDNYDVHNLSIVNVLGATLYSKDFYPPFFEVKSQEVDLRKIVLPTGIYIVSIRNKTGVRSEKVLLYD